MKMKKLTCDNQLDLNSLKSPKYTSEQKKSFRSKMKERRILHARKEAAAWNSAREFVFSI